MLLHKTFVCLNSTLTALPTYQHILEKKDFVCDKINQRLQYVLLIFFLKPNIVKLNPSHNCYIRIRQKNKHYFQPLPPSLDTTRWQLVKFGRLWS